MNKQNSRIRRGLKAKALIRKSGRVRLVVHRSGLHIYSQIVRADELGDKVLVACSTNDKEIRASLSGKCKVEQANLVGKLLGKRASEHGITEVAFDRAGYKYHGRVKALAEGAREAGLDF
ncbi:50S ribosomal protein L18 [Legionella longbeachae]|uniref:Large ribosomal subunit protein uL18 n=1 Tax=Legionella longbeachae serogroup 1 (strain NSW150) TaxID=661367 RepID=D3HPL9_LEGLN|nr:50S ribosomal protein L18 [Legionella longbeachae]VEE01356.1 50S ribosomal protein L18 [Legionella oakridgensis]HBD7396073.1 50S ribosomal protein L18 [Legionella pneumophila]ARB92280.1 50S ribosomal protein L18 [Legionella longbeachae]ARM34539.1 50S ribosomal protein L18 [Legionella longbeachae]EEZ96173.1 ribosomal protein L18 [Legionella longbeachae D-4968]